MTAVIALALGLAFLLADKHLPLWAAGKRPQGALSRLFGGRVRTDP